MTKQSLVAKCLPALARTLGAVFVVALILGSAGPAMPVRASPDRSDDVYFDVYAFPEAPPPICVNKTRSFYVSVNKGIDKTINGKDVQESGGRVLGGVSIHSSQSNPNAGKLAPEADVPITVDSGDSSPGQVTYVFTAKQKGTTILRFESNGIIGGGADVSGSDGLGSLGTKIPAKKAEIPVTVINCAFKVNTIHRQTAQSADTDGIGEVAKLVADEQGNVQGTSTVNWAIRNTSSCTFSALSTTPTQVAWTGKLDNAQLLLKGTFQPTTTTLAFTCPDGGSDSQSHVSSIAPLAVSVSDEGGVARQSQMIGNAGGSAVVIVIPDECTAAC